jgi:cobaltochelatase CobT
VRYEALGANFYAGMRDNLDAATEMRLRSDDFARRTRRAGADGRPLSLLLRES